MTENIKSETVLHMGFSLINGNKSINEEKLFSVLAEADNNLRIINRYDNILKLTFDDVTGKLKSAEVIS